MFDEESVQKCGLDSETLKAYEAVKEKATKVVARKDGIHAVIDCPYCGKEHRHGWAGGDGFRSPHCVKPKERLNDYYLIFE